MKIGKVYITSDNTVCQSPEIAIDREIALTSEIEELPFGIQDNISNKTELVGWIRKNKELVTHIIQEGERLEREIQTEKPEPSSLVEKWAAILGESYHVIESEEWDKLFATSPFHAYRDSISEEMEGCYIPDSKEISYTIDSLKIILTFYYHESRQN